MTEQESVPTCAIFGLREQELHALASWVIEAMMESRGMVEFLERVRERAEEDFTNAAVLWYLAGKDTGLNDIMNELHRYGYQAALEFLRRRYIE